MAGPFDPAVREKFHANMKKMLGYAPANPVIDPMEEMAARDRERGADISNPYPVARSAFMQSADEFGDSEVAGAPLPEDTEKPYEGMNFFKAMVTPMSTAAAGRPARMASTPKATPPSTIGTLLGRSTPAEQIPPPATGMAGTPDTIDGLRKMALDVNVPRATRLDAAAALAYQLAIDAQSRGDEKQAATYAKLYQLSNTQAMQFHSLDSAEKQARDTYAQRSKEIELQNQGLLSAENARADATIRVNRDLQSLDRETASLATGVSDDLAPLADDPAMSVMEYAKVRRNMAAAQQSASGQVDPALVASEEDNAYRQGFRYRAGQYVSESLTNPMAPEFNESHPRMKEFQNYYRSLVKAKPSEYQRIRDEVEVNIGGAFASSVARWSASEGIPTDYKETIAEIGRVVNAIVGPAPEPGYLWGVQTPK